MKKIEKVNDHQGSIRTVVPLTARKSYQSILKEINPKYSLEGLMLTLQYFGHLLQRANSLEKTLILGKTEGRRRRRWQRMRWLDSITDSMDMNLRKFQEIMKDRRPCHSVVHGVTKSQTQQLKNNNNVTVASKGCHFMLIGDADLRHNCR